MSRQRRAVLIAAAAMALAGGGVAVAVTEHGRTLSPAQATSQWEVNGQFSGGVVDLLRDANWVRLAATRDQPAVARTYCAYLYTDAQGENTDLLPTPDRQLTGLLSDAYDGFIQAAAVCTEHSTSRQDLGRVAAEVARSVTELTEAVLREEAVTGSSLRIRGIP